MNDILEKCHRSFADAQYFISNFNWTIIEFDRIKNLKPFRGKHNEFDFS